MSPATLPSEIWSMSTKWKVKYEKLKNWGYVRSLKCVYFPSQLTEKLINDHLSFFAHFHLFSLSVCYRLSVFSAQVSQEYHFRCCW